MMGAASPKDSMTVLASSSTIENSGPIRGVHVLSGGTCTTCGGDDWSDWDSLQDIVIVAQETQILTFNTFILNIGDKVEGAFSSLNHVNTDL